ncbi:MAG: hypothetical protein PV340_03390 [Wolbachia sp.]|nr:hypothetical protein [Wolbachia sp.]MDD9336465.1 hypothetical protein [Wolbachia sp.]
MNVLNPCNLCNSSSQTKRDADIVLKQVVEHRTRISLHVEMLPSSTKVGIRWLGIEAGLVAFLVPWHLVDKSERIYKLRQKKINNIQK